MLYIDLETLDFFQDEHIKTLPRNEQLAAMRFGCAVTYDAHNDEWNWWKEEQIVDLFNHVVWCCQSVIGWNIIDFDWPIIISNARRAGWNVLEIETETVRLFDLFAEIRRTTGRWYKLEDVCQATLGRGKLADGQKAAEWLRSGDPELARKALNYCRHDVQLVIELHGRLLRGDPLILPPRPARQELNEIRWWLDRQERIPDASGALSLK